MKNDSYQSPANNGSVGVGLIGGREMSLHDRIMALPVFNTGAEVTRLQAANRAKEADELMAEMASVLESASIGAVVIDSAKDVLDKYDDWKEQAK